MLAFAVCDDEPAMAEELAGRISACLAERGAGDFRVSRFSSGRALLAAGDSFDAVFLDIRLEGEDGMEAARALRRRGSGSLIVFVTVLEELVFDAFAVEAFDYLVKPVEAGRLARTMDRVLRALEGRRRDRKSVVRERVFCWV